MSISEINLFMYFLIFKLKIHKKEIVCHSYLFKKELNLFHMTLKIDKK